MVREVPLEVELPETDVSNAFQVLFGNEEAVVAYHTKTNPGSEPEVTPWEQQHRTVRFTLDLSTSIPQFLKRVVGVSVVKVTETQTVAWEGREVVRIDSSPILDVRISHPCTFALRARKPKADAGMSSPDHDTDMARAL